MVRVAILSTDQKLISQINSWIQEFPADLTLLPYRSVQDLASGIQALAGEIPADSDNDESSESGQKAIRLVIVDYDFVLREIPKRIALGPDAEPPVTPLEWLSYLKEELKKGGLSEEACPVRTLVMTFENGQVTPDKLRHDSVDDLILQPLDRTLFLQKIEYLVSEKPDVRPSFLYRQKTEIMIEIGKDAQIDEISEFAVALRNPGPLSAGVFASIHSSIFGMKDEGRVIGRVYQSCRHPTLKNSYLVRFAFFGITPAQILNVRKYIRSLQGDKHRHFGVEDNQKSASPEVPEEQKRRIAVVDMDPFSFEALKSALEANLVGVRVVHFPSYGRFLNQYVRRANAQEESSAARSTGPPAQVSSSPEPENTTGSSTPPAPETESVDPAFPGGQKMTAILDGENFELLRFDPHPRRSQIILGAPFSEWLERKDKFSRSIHDEDREEIAEFFSYLKAGTKGRYIFRLHDANQKIVYVQAEGSLEKSGEDDGRTLIRLDLIEVEVEKWLETHSGLTGHLEASALRFDAVFVDAATIQIEPQDFIERQKEWMLKSNVYSSDEETPPIFITADSSSRVNVDSFKLKGIGDFVFKPYDRKFVAEKVAALSSTLKLSKPPEGTGFEPCRIRIKVAKDAVMVELSEYGLSIQLPYSFQDKVFMRFFSPLFGEHADGILARSAYCKKPEGKDQPYRCDFVFFGVTDELLKRIRKWIREDYVSHKESAAS